MTSKFEPEKYKNDYRDKLLSAIEDKIAGKKISGDVETIIKPRSIINLMEALKNSIEKPNKKTKNKVIEKNKISKKTKKNNISKSA